MTSPQGIDIANQIGPVVAKPLLQSQRHALLLPFGMISNAKYPRSKSSSQLLAVLFASLAPNSWWPILTPLSLRLATSTRTRSFPASHPAIVQPTGGQRTHYTYGQLFYTPHLLSRFSHYPIELSLGLSSNPKRRRLHAPGLAASLCRAVKLWTLLIELAKRQIPVRKAELTTRSSIPKT